VMGWVRMREAGVFCGIFKRVTASVARI